MGLARRQGACRLPARSPRAGFTLLEAMVASVILAVAVLAFCQAVAAGQMATAEALHGVRATLLADAMLEEVLSLPYADPQSPDTETTRANFDDLDDFHNFTQTLGNVTDATGAAYPPPYRLFSRSVTVTTTTAATPGGTANGKRITVRVRDAKGGEWIVTHFVPEPLDG